MSSSDSLLNDKRFSLDRLATLKEIVAAGGIVDATGQDPSRQSLYSKHKSELEKALGEKLFVRSNGKLKPTEFGKELVALVNAFEGALEDLRGRQSKSERPITIGAGDSVFHWLLLPITNQLQAEFKGNTFRFQNLTTRQIIEGVGEGSIDIGIAREGSLPANVIATPLRSFRFGLFYDPEYFEEHKFEGILRTQKLIGLSGNGSYATATRKLLSQLQLGSNEPTSCFDSLPMIENALISMRACAILPIEAECRLLKNGFELLTDPSLAAFDRDYFIYTNSSNDRLRPILSRIGKRLVELIG